MTPGARYEAVEIDGKWYVMDHRDPTRGALVKSQEEAKRDARIWNLLYVR